VSFIETVGIRYCDLRSQFVNLLFPPRCVGCGGVGAWLCGECISQIPRVESPVCPRCGSAVLAEGLCSRCRTSPLQIDAIRSVVLLDGVLRHAVHLLKYEGRTVLAQPLGEVMAAYWLEHRMPADVVVPVALHPDRFRERGYNQSTLLAREMARRVGLAVDEQTLIRRRATAPQVTLDARHRRENVRDAFACSGDALVGKHVLLVDDVCTTGATLEACAIAVRDQGGARTVRALTLARAS
jgi:ComF family protein